MVPVDERVGSSLASDLRESAKVLDKARGEEYVARGQEECSLVDGFLELLRIDQYIEIGLQVISLLPSR